METKKLADKLQEFMYDWDPYEFVDNFDSYENANEYFENLLSSKKDTKEVIYNIKEIVDDVKGDTDEHINNIYVRGSELICDLEEHLKNLDNYEI